MVFMKVCQRLGHVLKYYVHVLLFHFLLPDKVPVQDL